MYGSARLSNGTTMLAVARTEKVLFPNENIHPPLKKNKKDRFYKFFSKPQEAPALHRSRLPAARKQGLPQV